MNRARGNVHTLEDLVARILFQDQHRMRSFDGAKPYLTALSRKRAQDAMKRSGIKNVTVDMEITDPKEGAR